MGRVRHFRRAITPRGPTRRGRRLYRAQDLWGKRVRGRDRGVAVLRDIGVAVLQNIGLAVLLGILMMSCPR